MTQSSSLLGYPIVRTAQRSLLHGGVRLSRLVAEPHPLHYTASERVTLPSAPNERRQTDEFLEPSHLAMRLMPINISLRAREQMVVLRNQDVFERFQQANRRPVTEEQEDRGRGGAARPPRRDELYHPPAKDLSIIPVASSVSSWSARKVDPNVDVFPRYMPMQMVKPMQSNWAPAVRGAGMRSTRGALFQERLDGKGFGWKKKARGLWQQDVETAGFRPRRYF